MLKFLYLATFSFSLFLSTISEYVVCNDIYSSYPLDYSSNIGCSNTTGPRRYLCPLQNCTTTIGGTIANNLVFTNCQDQLNSSQHFPFVWPKFMYHNKPGNIQVAGQWSLTNNPVRKDLDGYVDCAVNGKYHVNTVRAACHACVLEPLRQKPPPGEEPPPWRYKPRRKRPPPK